MPSESLHPYSTRVYTHVGELPVHARFYPAPQPRKDKTVIYIHGGGFIYGSYTDLPENYLHMILTAGYDFLTLEYPLAPETSIAAIIETLQTGVEWFLEEYDRSLGLSSAEYILFGRSAGAYLALIITKRAAIPPKAILAFYGYYSLLEPSFQVPNRHYLSFTRISTATARKLIGQKPLTVGSKETRYALYVYYRQNGNWITETVRDKERARTLSLTHSELTLFPPVFSTASTEDPDVPSRISEKLASLIPHSLFIPISSDVHDFDRVFADTAGKAVYQKMLDWLDDTLP